MQLGRLGVVLATCAGAAAQANEKPGVVDGTKIFQSRVGVQVGRIIHTNHVSCGAHGFVCRQPVSTGRH